MGIKFKGLKALKSALDAKKTTKATNSVVLHHGTQLTRKMQRKAVFRGHMGYKPGVKGLTFIPPTGATRRSIKMAMQQSPKSITATVRPYTEYAPYLELGTRFMDAQPFVRPALREVEGDFIRDIKRVGAERK